MNFFIRQRATLPILKMQLVRDDQMDYNKFYEMLETCIGIEFSMVNRDTGAYKLSKAHAEIVKSNDGTQYYVVYKFNERDTSEPGVFYGEFKLVFFTNSEECQEATKFNQGTLKMPIRDELFIHVIESYAN